MSPATLTIIILICAVISFLLEKIPVNMTVMLTLIALVLTRLVTPKEAVAGFASTTILMLIGVVIVGSALFETGVCDKIASVVTRFAKTERQMIMAILVCGLEQFWNCSCFYSYYHGNLRIHWV